MNKNHCRKYYFTQTTNIEGIQYSILYTNQLHGQLTLNTDER